MPMPMPLSGGPGPLSPDMAGAPPASPQGGGGMDLASLLGGGAPSAASPDAAMGNSVRQFDQLERMVQDLMGMFPGNEDAAQQILDGLMRWKQNVLISTQAPPSAMPGAQGMI